MDRDKYPTIFHIDIDAFFASVEEALDPKLAGKAVIVGGLKTDRGVVACPNYEARKLGVKTAMPLSEARVLAPNAVFVRGSYRAYEDYSHRFARILRSFSPDVQVASFDEAYLDANGCLHFWDYQPAQLATAIKKAIWNELKITVSIGVASNKTCAKVATDYSKTVARSSRDVGPPNGLHVVELGKEREFLEPLPVSAIPGIGKRTTEALANLGIGTIGSLAAYDKKSLNRIFGVTGHFLHNASNGRGQEELAAGSHFAKSISRSTTFGEDSADEDYIRSVMFSLAESVAAELREGKRTALTVGVKMRYSNFAPLLGIGGTSRAGDRRFVTYQKDHTLDEPTNSEVEITSVAFSLFKTLWLPGTKVRYVGVAVTNIKHECDQLDMFMTGRDRFRDLLAGIDNIRGKFGYGSVYFGIVKTANRRRPAGPRGFGFAPQSVPR